MNFIFPKLYATSSSGKVKEWHIKVIDNKNDTASIITTFGYKNGKMQITEDVISEGKNIGKANETTPFIQAYNEAQSKFNLKKDKNYYEFITEKKLNLLPMLALKFRERKHDIKYPAYIQPKLNGVRCLARKVSESEIEYTSRGGKKWKFFSHLTPDLLKMMKIGDIFDGEIFNPEFSFQEITNFIKKEKPETKELQYWIYDMVSDLDFKERELYVRTATNNIISENIVDVKSVIVRNEDEVEFYFKRFISHNFEGAMIRNMSGGYVCDHRSSNLQKLKAIKDAEFKIVGGKSGRGKFKDCVTFTCDNGSGNTFDVVPKGTIEDKQEYLRNIDKYIGKMLTIEFEDYSKDGIPLKPVGIAIRDYE